MKSYKIGIIGTGNMASAIISGILSSGFLKNEEIIIFDIDLEKTNKLTNLYNIEISNNISDIFYLSNYVLLSIKPQNLTDIIPVIKLSYNASNNIIISILAGIPTYYFEKVLGGKPKIIRVMPNSPVLVKKGLSAISTGKYTKRTDLKFVIDLFNCVGTTILIEERFQNLVTSLSGSGPAYFYLFCKHLIDFGVENGLPFEISKKMVIDTFIGSGEIMNLGEDSLDSLIKKVASKGGTTEKALESFEKNKFKLIVNEALKSAFQKACEIEKSFS